MGDLESLYPFLYSGKSDVDAVLAQVCRSTTEKTEEITQLRAEVLKLYRDQLIDCASAMARSFAAGGRLFTFGNGGSSTDAQAIAELFQNPGPAGHPLPAAALATDVAVLSALANDVSFDVVFARPWPPTAAPGTSRWACPPAAGQPTCFAASRRPTAAACSPSVWPATTAAIWPRRTPSSTCS